MWLLLLMIGWQVAPVACEVVCPVASHADAAIAAAVPVTADDVPCHERDDDAATQQTDVSRGVMRAQVVPGCEHPPAAVSPRSTASVTVPMPAVVAVFASAHLSPQASSFAPDASSTHRPAWAPPVATRSLVLRI